VFLAKTGRSLEGDDESAGDAEAAAA
jgi:hypothetical protein